MVKKVAGKNEIHILHLKFRLFKRLPAGKLLHFAFGLFPGFFAEAGIFIDYVKIFSKGAFALFF